MEFPAIRVENLVEASWNCAEVNGDMLPQRAHIPFHHDVPGGPGILAKTGFLATRRFMKYSKRTAERT